MRTAVGAQGPRGIAERLSSAVRGWVLLIDADGGLRAAVPESSRTYLARILTELPRTGVPRAPLAAAISLPGESVSITSVSVAGRVRGYIAVGRTSNLSAAEHTLVETATYLIAEDLRRADEIRQAARNNRHAVLRLLLGGNARVARTTGEILRVKVPDGPVRAAVLTTSRENATELLEAVEEDQALRRIDTVSAALRPGRVAMILPTAEGDLRTIESILRRVPNCRGAASDPVSVDDLPDAWRRVRAVLQAASDEPGHLYLASDVSEAGLLRHLGGDDVRAWAQSALLPVANLTSGSKVDFTSTLRTFLANNGQADASASALGIHRHTLRYRMTKIGEALGRDLDDPTVRAELWLALKLE
ncbi:PucR family transcriptional regulator [Gordonia sp. TBRC 11910]|uniref:PucR family transcriptional regulator n=1 Tax=Gordonia asplenii TaxID=2725283 RepID=A0A848L6E1_9ACTN|nr:helix-turn-helix domain-containing protein [Gordonia asplenii]NMO04101.1 PucR family transcriptional regulator [Gordonia asplenii]